MNITARTKNITVYENENFYIKVTHARAHGAAKVADTLEGHIAEMAAEADKLADKARAEGNAKEAAYLEGEAAGRILAARILGKAAQAMRAAAATAKAEADAPAPADADEAGEVPEWLAKQENALAREARAFESYRAMCEKQGVKVERRHEFRKDGLLIYTVYEYAGEGGTTSAICDNSFVGGNYRDNARVIRENGPAIAFKYPERAKAKAFAIAAGLEA